MHCHITRIPTRSRTILKSIRVGLFPAIPQDSTEHQWTHRPWEIIETSSFQQKGLTTIGSPSWLLHSVEDEGYDTHPMFDRGTARWIRSAISVVLEPGPCV